MNNLKKLYIIALGSIALAQSSLYAAAEPISDNDASGLLYQVIHDGDSALLQDLLASGINVNSKDETGKSPLHSAALYGKPKIMRLLLNARADFNQPDKNGWTPLFYAVQSGNTEAIETLLAIPLVKDRINHQDNDGKTPLHIAAMNGNPEIVCILLEAGATNNILDKGGKAPCDYSNSGLIYEIFCPPPVVSPIKSAAEPIVPAEADFSLSDKNGKTPLFYAVQSGNTDSVETLEPIVPDVSSDKKEEESTTLSTIEQLPDNTSPTAASYQSGCINGIETAPTFSLLNLHDYNGKTPLFYAAMNGQIATVQDLLRCGANCRISDNDSMQPIFYSITQGHKEITLMLKQAAISSRQSIKTNLPIPTINGLNEAIQHADIEQLFELFFYHTTTPNPNQLDECGEAPLHKAACFGSWKTIPILIAAGADPNLKTRAGKTPLIMAIEYYEHRFAQRLLQATGINVNSQDDLWGDTALHKAVIFHDLTSNDLTFVKLLLRTPNINLSIKNKSGKTALEIAHLKMDMIMIRLLNAYSPILTLLEAQHPRLGQNEKCTAHNLDTNCIRNIYEWLTKLAKNR